MTEKVNYELFGLDPLVIPMVEYFNKLGLKTCMSCQGHNKTNMSMFWIEFDKRVTEEDILNFMKKHLTFYGTFVSCGRFAKRVIGFYNPKSMEWSKGEYWCYFAATPEAADADLQRWQNDIGAFDGVDGKRYQAYRDELKLLEASRSIKSTTLNH